MADAPTIGRKGVSLDVAAFFRRYAALTALIVLLAFNFAVTPNFASWQTLNVNLTQVATIVIVSVGMTLVIATGGIDLSVGSLMAISGALAPMIFLSSFGLSYPALGNTLAFVVPVAVAGLFGAFNGWFITRFRVQPIVGTLVMFIAGRGIGQVLTNGNLQAFKNPTFQFIGLGRVFGVPCQVIIMLALVAAAAWTLRSTLFGRQILSVGGNERAARLSRRSGRFGQAMGLRDQRPVRRHRRPDRRVDQFVERRQPRRPRHGARRDRGGRGRRDAVHRRTGDGGRHADRRASDPARALHPARQRRAGRRGAGGQGRDHRRRGLVAAARQVDMSAGTANAAPRRRGRAASPGPARQRVVMALVLLILFGALRYDHFLGAYNVLSVLRYNSMFALTSLGMCFVIMTAGIDLSVGTTAACASVVSALLSPYGLFPGLLGGLGAGLAVGAINGFMVTRMNIQPFIATLSGMLAASGTGLLLAHNQSVSVSYDTDFTWLGQGDFLGFPDAGLDRRRRPTSTARSCSTSPSFGRYVLAIGGNEEAARLMGLPVDRVKFWTYVQSGVFAGLAGVILAAQFGAGQPAEGVGWELFSIAAVVVGGTLLTGGVGSVATTLAGVLLLGLIFNVLNFENGLGWISLSAYWQSVVRGVFLMVVVMASSGAARRAVRSA